MKVVFDKENAISFFKNLDDYEIGDDVLKLLKRQVDLQFNFDLDDIGEELELQILEFEEFGGRKENNLSISYNKNKGPEIFCVEHIENNDDILLLKNISEKIKNAHRVLVGGIGDEITVLRKLFLNETDVSVQENIEIGSDDFKKWEDIEVFNRPFSSIVIVDRYLFKGPEIGGNYGLIDFNLSKILGVLYKNQSQRTILTFIYQINTSVSKTSIKYDEGPDLEKLRLKIKKGVKMYNKYCPIPIICFVAVPYGKIDDEHDRHIITNYLRIKSGDTLVYFNSSNEIVTKSNEFDIYSLARKKYRDTAQSLIKKLQEITKNVIDEHINGCKVPAGLTEKDIINF